MIDLYYPDYAAVSTAVTTPDAGAFFAGMSRLASGGVRVLAATSKYSSPHSEPDARRAARKRYGLMKRIALSTACGAIALVAGLAACSSAHQPVPSSSKAAALQQVRIP
jgi:hypothetical protein